MSQIGLDSQSLTDAVFEALADQQRRHLLRFLAYSETETVSFEAVSAHIAASLDLTVEFVQANLHHKDLPKLEQAGFVEYDERSGAIRSRNSELLSKLRKAGLLDCTTQTDR